MKVQWQKWQMFIIFLCHLRTQIKSLYITSTRTAFFRSLIHNVCICIYIYIYIHTHIYVYVTLLTSYSILFQPFNHPQSCPTKRNTRKSHLYYFICPVTSLLHTALRLQSSRMLHHVVGRWVPSTQLTPSLPHWRRRQQASADMVPTYRSTKCHITEDNIHKCNHFKSHIVRNVITLLGLWHWLHTKCAAI